MNFNNLKLVIQSLSIKRFVIYLSILFFLTLISIIFLKYFYSSPKNDISAQETQQEQAEDHYNRIINSLQKEDYLNILLEGKNFLNKYPKHVLSSKVIYYMGESYNRQNQYADAIKEFERIVKNYPGTNYADLSLGRIQLIKQKMNEQQMEFSSTSSLLKAYESIYKDYRNRNFDASIAGFKKFLDDYPDSDLTSNAIYWIGESYYGKEDYLNAIKYFNQVIQKFPNSEKAIHSARKIEMSQSKIKTEVAPDETKNIYQSIYTLYRAKKYDRAIDGFKSFIKKFPKSRFMPNAYYWIGECYYAKADYEDGIYTTTEENFKKAIDYFSEVIRLFPKSNKTADAKKKITHINIVRDYINARTLYLSEKYVPAINSFKRLIQNYPSHIYVPNFIYWMADSYKNLGDFKNATIQFNKIIKNFPNNHKANDAKKRLLEISTSQKMEDKTISSPAKTENSQSTINKQVIDELYSKGQAAYYESDYKNAITYFNRIISDLPSYSKIVDVNFFLADSYFLSKDFRSALPIYNALLESVKKGEISMNIGFLENRISDCKANI